MAGRAALLAGSIERDAVARFSLRDASFKAGDASEDCSASFIRGKIEMRSYGRGRAGRTFLS
jgi:hypothetical protein